MTIFRVILDLTVIFTCWSIVVHAASSGYRSAEDEELSSGSGSGSAGEGSAHLCDDEDLECEPNGNSKHSTAKPTKQTKTTHTTHATPIKTTKIPSMATATSSVPLYTIGQPSFRGNSYMALPRLPMSVRNSLEILIRFKASSRDGLLMYSGRQSGTKDFLAVGLVKGFVEMRFSNGADTVVLATPNSVTLGQWHQVVIFRDQRDGYVTLDYGQLVSASSRKNKKLMNLNTAFYVGGLPQYDVNNVPYVHGFHGCIKELVIDNKRVDLRLPGGDAKRSKNIDECHSSSLKCQCKNGGVCQFTRQGQPLCACPLNTAGQYCEQKITLKIPSFSGHSHLSYPSLGDVASKSFTIRLSLKPSQGTGLIFLNTDRAKGQGDYFSLSLREGMVEFLFDCGSGSAIIRSKEPISIDYWHTITIWRNGGKGSLKVDNGLPVFGESPGRFRYIGLRQKLFIGGLKDYKHQPYHVNMMSGFAGCIQKVTVNSLPFDLSSPLSGQNINNCDHVCVTQSVCQNGGTCHAEMNTFQCQCPIGFTGTLCDKRIDIKMPSFPGKSYLTYPSLGAKAYDTLTMTVTLKPRKTTGLILYNGRTGNSKGDYVSLALRNGFVEFVFDCGSGAAFLRSKSKILIGQWHTITISRTGRQGKLKLDNGSPVFGKSPGYFRHVTLINDLFLGGMKDFSQQPLSIGVRTGYVGCIQKVTVNSRPLVLSSPRSGVNVHNCDHVCVTNYVCMNGGTCHAEMDRFKCECADGYAGMICDRVVKVNSYYFDGGSFVTLTKKKIMNRISGWTTDVRLRLKTGFSKGLLIFVHKANSLHKMYFVVLINHGVIEVRYKKGNKVKTFIKSKQIVNDDQWHTVHLSRTSSSWKIYVDGKKTVIKTKLKEQFDFYRGEMFIGGSPNQSIDWPKFKGRIKDLSIGGHNIDITEESLVGVKARRYRTSYTKYSLNS